MAILTHFNRVHRKRKPGVSIHRVAAASGVPRSILQNWRHARITRFDEATLDKLCAYFKCQPGDLLEYVPDHKVAQHVPPPPFSSDGEEPEATGVHLL